MYRIQLTKNAEKSFDKIMKSQPKIGRRITQAIDRLSQNPDAGIPLRGRLKGYHKYRVGSYRIIYEIRRSLLVVIIIDIGDRKEIYR